MDIKKHQIFCVSNKNRVAMHCVYLHINNKQELHPFNYDVAAAKVISELNGAEFDGCAMVVKEATPRS